MFQLYWSTWNHGSRSKNGLMNITELASEKLLRYLDRERFLRIRNSYLKLRKMSSPIIKLVYGAFTTEDLTRELESRLVEPFDILMVHSSYNSLLPMYQGSPMELLRGLAKFCGEDRTLVMPAFYFGEPNSGGARPTFEKNSRFDLKRTPSQMGLLTELFRRTKGVHQSLHPVYRVAALGPLAEQLVAGQEFSPTGMGENTPFDFMAKNRTRIIGIGKTFQVMTQVHHVESLLGERFPFRGHSAPPLPVTLVKGTEEIIVNIGGRGVEGTFNIWKLREIMDVGQLQEWRYHNTPMFSADAAIVTERLTDAALNQQFTLYD